MNVTWLCSLLLFSSSQLSAQWSIACSDIWLPTATNWSSNHSGYYPGWNTLSAHWQEGTWAVSGTVNAVPSLSTIGLGSRIQMNAQHSCDLALHYRAKRIVSTLRWHWQQDAITQWHGGLQCSGKDCSVSLTMLSHGPSGWHVIIGSRYQLGQAYGQWTVGAMREGSVVQSVSCTGSGQIQIQLMLDPWRITLGWSPWGPYSSVGQMWPAKD